MKATKDYPVPTNSIYCHSSSHTCQHLLTPTSNSRKLDTCILFDCFIDRGNRKKLPERSTFCMATWPHKGI